MRLSKRVTLSRGAYYFRPSEADRRIRLGNTTKEARANLDLISSKVVPLRTDSAAALARAKTQLWAGMNARARRAPMLCMTRDQFETLWARAAGRCELTAIRFSMERIRKCIKRPWSPSIDRLDCSRGYELDNCRLVCTAVNLALNEFGDEVLRKIASALR